MESLGGHAWVVSALGLEPEPKKSPPPFLLFFLRGWVGGNSAPGSTRMSTSSRWSPKIVSRATPGPWKWHCVDCEGVEDADGFSWLHFFHFLF